MERRPEERREAMGNWRGRESGGARTKYEWTAKGDVEVCEDVPGIERFNGSENGRRLYRVAGRPEIFASLDAAWKAAGVQS